MTDSDKLRLWNNLGTLSVQSDDLDSARSYFRLVAEKDPKNIVIRCLLCELSLRVYEKGQTPDLQDLGKLLGEIEQLGGHGPYWLYGEAIRILVYWIKRPRKTSSKPAVTCKMLGGPKGLVSPGRFGRQDLRTAERTRSGIGLLYTGHLSDGERDSDVIRRTVHLLLPRGCGGEAKQLFDYLEKQKSPLLGEMNQDYVYMKSSRATLLKPRKTLRNRLLPIVRSMKTFSPDSCTAFSPCG